MQISEKMEFPDRRSAYEFLQREGFRLWQWLDHTSCVWWGPARSRLFAREMEDGRCLVSPLPALDWSSISRSQATVANTPEAARLGEGVAGAS
jgi:hypothetical protein